MGYEYQGNAMKDDPRGDDARKLEVQRRIESCPS